MNLQILPLAITMMAGPQIMSAIIFVTASKPVKISASFIAGVAIATTVGVAIAFTAVNLLGNSVSLGDSSDSGSTGHIIQYLLVGALVALAVKNYLGRETVEPPRWLGTLMSADPKQALKTGLLGDPAYALRHHHHADGGREPRAKQLGTGGRSAVHRSDRADRSAPLVALPAVPKARSG